MYLLDTNTCIFIKNKKPIHGLDRLRKALDHTIFLSSITIAEMQSGIYNSRNIEKNRISLTEFLAPFEILDFDDRDAEMFGMIRSQFTPYILRMFVH